MYLINTGRSPKYSSLANKVLNPGSRSRDLSLFSDAFNDILKKVSGFKARLSDSDIHVLSRLIDEWVSDELSGGGEVSAMSYDPGAGMRRVVNDLIARRKASKDAMSAALERQSERESRAMSESNFIDESGNPIEDKTVSQASQRSIEPELHPEMADDLSKVLANNLAVMTTASGQPIKNPGGVVAGSTVVPHDPEYYRTHWTGLPPGMPDLRPEGGAR